MVLWSNFYPLIFWAYDIEFHERMKTPFTVCPYPHYVPEIFKFKKWVNYANEMTDDVIHSTQYYINAYNLDYLGQFAVQNIENWQAESSTGITHMAIKNSCSHGNSLFSSPHPLDINKLKTCSLKNIKQGHKLELTYLYACWIMRMECC